MNGVERLPGDLGMVEDALGREAAIALGDRLRSAEIYIPKTYDRARLSKTMLAVRAVLGESMTERLVEDMGGCRIRVHNLDCLQREKRNEAMRADYDKGATAMDLAIKYKVSTRTVFYVLGTV